MIKKRILCFVMVLLIMCGAVHAALAEENIPSGPNFIPVNDFYKPNANEGSLYGWEVLGANIAGYEVVTTGTGNYPNRTFNILLENGTPMDAVLTILCYTDKKSAAVPMVNTQPGLTALARVNNWNAFKKNDYKAAVPFENGTGTLSLYVYSYAGDTGVTIHTFNFSIAEADNSDDPDPDTVESIAITEPPTKTTYYAGERFDPAGMVVMATLNEGDPVPVVGYAYEPSGALTMNDTAITVSFGDFTATQGIEVLPSAAIGSIEITNGQLMGDFVDHGFGIISRKDKAYDAVVLYGENKGKFIIHVGEGAGVYIGDTAQNVTDGRCELSLDTSVEGTVTTVRVQAAENYADYTFTCYSQQYSGMPTSVVEYLCIASQYTNGSSLGPYGLNAVPTLRGVWTTSETAHDGTNGGPTSLGNFGGYITYYYEDAIVDDPRNPYGIDFIVFGNSYDGSNAFAEPGNVLVSEDGETWYNLAGSLHYEDNAVWDYSMTYTNVGSGSSWTDNRGGSGTADKYPQRVYYPLFPWTEELESQITVTGVLLEPAKGTNEYGNTVPPYPDFGYADSGDEGITNEAFNPYTGTYYNEETKRTYSGKTDGFDLKWAVDGSGYPVELTNGVRYVKIQTASNISNSGIGEKSTEIHMVRVAAPDESDVGVSSAPSAITVDGRVVNVVESVYTYNVPVSGTFEVVVTAAEDAHVYINGARRTNVTFGKTPVHGIIRVIVQEGEKAPLIYYLTITEDEGGEDAAHTAVTFDANGGRVEDQPSITRYYDAGTQNTVFPTPVRDGYTFLGWYSGQESYIAYTPDMPETLTLTASWRQNNPGSTLINVTFRLIGATLAGKDVDLGSKINDSEYVTWIATKRYTMNRSDTVYDLFVEAIADAGLHAQGQDTNYVKTITAPASLGGYELSEFTNGQFSGWMYTVNGKHPGFGLRERDLNNGDQVIWHYVNDWRYEIEDWFDDPDYPALGDGSDWNKWLLAEDKEPDRNNTPSGSMPPASSDPGVLTPKVTASNGMAASKISESDIASIIASIKEKINTAIVITPEITGQAKKVSIELPKSSVSSIASETDAALTLRTPVGNVTIPNSVMASITGQATDNSITVSLESMDSSSLTTGQQTVIGDNPVYDISIVSGSSHISNFGNGSITVSLPYTLKDGEDPGKVAVWYLTDRDELEKLVCNYDKETGMATFTTSHLSYYVVGYNAAIAWENPFTDVKDTDWYYKHVEFAVQNGLFNGTGTTTFSPDLPMTRAMLVTALYRLEGSPTVTGVNGFVDVKNGEWYTDAVIWANTNDIITGYGDGLFGTGDNVMRQQLATILYRYAAKKGYDTSTAGTLSQFNDGGKIPDYALEAMKWATGSALMRGDDNGALNPSGSATRAEVAVVLQRFVEGFVK